MTKPKNSPARLRATAKFDAAHAHYFRIKVLDTTDSDILEWMEKIPNKQGYLKKLIREDMAKEKK